jgi:hypothetical protein
MQKVEGSRPFSRFRDMNVPTTADTEHPTRGVVVIDVLSRLAASRLASSAPSNASDRVVAELSGDRDQIVRARGTAALAPLDVAPHERSDREILLAQLGLV